MMMMKKQYICKCEAVNTKYNERYDAYYCLICGQWLEKACDDPKCWYCNDRPKKMIKKNPKENK
jgi:hypothetical protein